MTGRDEPNWNVQSCVLNTNRDRFHEKPDGVIFKVDYIDTGHQNPNRANMPTVFVIPTSPGTHRDLLSVVSPLAYKGMRVIIPNMPGFEHCEQIVQVGSRYVPAYTDSVFFTHTTIERLDFILRFLSYLEVSELDLAVGYGYGSVPLLVMLNTPFEAQINSVMFLCPTPVHIPSTFARPAWWVGTLLDLLDSRRLKTLSGITLPYIHAKLKGFKSRNAEERFNALQVAAGVGFYGMPDYATALGTKKKPFSYIFTENTKLFKRDDYEAYAGMMGMPKERMLITDDHGTWKDTFDANLKRSVMFPTSIDVPQNMGIFRNFITKDLFHLLALGHAHSESSSSSSDATKAEN